MNEITVLSDENMEEKRTTEGKLLPSDHLDGFRGRDESEEEPGGEVE